MNVAACEKIQNDLNRAFCFILALSIAALTMSYGLEIFFHLQPCRVCNLQRIVYQSTASLATAGILLPQKNLIGGILVCLSISGILLASYHIGIQMDIFPDFCAALSPTNLDHFKKLLFQSQPHCSSVHRLFFIPLSMWNLIFSLLFTFSIFIAHRSANKRHEI